MADSFKMFSLVKYDKPQLLRAERSRATPTARGYQSLFGTCGNDDFIDEATIERCKESALSQIETEQILNAIAPPREWEDEGKRFRQNISQVPATRADILDLNDALNEQLTNRQARPDGICPIRRELATQAFDELIRQITISQPERGLLLLRVRDELRMTLSAYQDLFVSSRDYCPYKEVLKESFTHEAEMESKLDGLKAVVKELQKERDELLKVLENEDETFKEEREQCSKKHGNEFHFLKRVNNVLKQHIEQMLDPHNNIDLAIEVFNEHPEDKKNRPRKGKKDKCKKEKEVSISQ